MLDTERFVQEEPDANVDDARCCDLEAIPIWEVRVSGPSHLRWDVFDSAEKGKVPGLCGVPHSPTCVGVR